MRAVRGVSTPAAIRCGRKAGKSDDHGSDFE
jgi:hypothetical protein